MQPVVVKPTSEPAIYVFNRLSATGTEILFAAIVSGFVMGCGPTQIARVYWKTMVRVRFSLLTIACMLGPGFLTR